ncbi:sensor histidine kinase [Enterococcus wangshanyuanii]|uniref:histidine kinase n=1 Tax=Enterococcus wangshanyuanii TaxID=2005703 RepID=A0ABQ1P056_9ENTE|nr:HAMP domain-containing sensor histidine kinase [Enterococcus wangshanyuanii]GGC86839.1 two-component sensor histidine kinase [Enterococcus wangshanyuanii]
MTIKRRFLISYIGGITIACLSLVSIICIVLYVTTGRIPSPGTLYRTFTQQRSLSPEEELAYVKLRGIAKTEPEQLLDPQEDVKKMIQQFEGEALGIVVRQNEEISYYSKELVEKSLIVHFPKFDANNIETKGTIDNAGRLYRYMKFDFYFKDQVPGTLLVLKKENNILDFMTKWGIWIIVFILLLSIGGVLFLNQLLKKTIIQPLENLGSGMSEIGTGHLQAPMTKQPEKTALEVKQLTDDFEKMRTALISSTNEQEKLEVNRKELVASISHDLKTPITSIIGYVEGLLDGVADSPEKQDKYLQTIHTKAIALNELIEELFLYSKLDADAIAFHFEAIKINEFLKHLIEEFQLRKQQVSLELIDQTASSSKVYGDRMQLNRVFTNLIENSLKFKQKEHPLTVNINLIDQDQFVEIRVTDNGQGIAKEQLPFVFDHFYRGEEARPTQTGGSGLGLAIVKQIVDRHEGKVMIESEVNKGTAVIILLKKVDGGQVDV